MKAVCKKLFSLMLVAILLVSAVPFQASAVEVEETIEATAPAVDAGVALDKDEVRVDFQLAENSDLGINTTYRVSRVKSKLGSKAAAPSASEALATLKKAIGSVEGIEFVRWYYVKGGENVTYTSSLVLNRDNMTWETRDENEDGIEYDYLDVYAEFATVPTNIKLDANGGTVASTKFKVELNKSYDAYGALPTPTRAGYNFLGWFKADGTQVTNETIVTSMGTLTAKWAAGKFTVTYKGNVDGEWTEVGFGSFDVDNGSVLKAEYNNFPTDAQIKAMFKLDGWTIDGWEYSNDDEATWKTFKPGTTKITGTTTIRPLYKTSITLYACDSGNTTRSLTVTLGKAYPALPHPGTREGYAFVGWYSSLDFGEGDLISTKDNLSNVSKHPIVESDADLYAGWHEAKTVYLYIYTNGNTKEHTKLVRYYDVPANGFSLNSIDLYEIFPNYGKYDDEGDAKYGWYDNAQWKNYCMDKHVNDTTEYVTGEYLEGDDVHEFHIMLIDNGNNASTGSSNGTGYNDNKTTVDSSNPSTGDEIFMFVTIMAISATALVLFFMNKKRFVK